MEQVGFVRRIVGDKAELEVKRASGCGNCNGCASSCEVKAHYVVIKNSIDAKVGDFVELKGEPKSILKYMLILYMIPFAFLIAGVVYKINIYLRILFGSPLSSTKSPTLASILFFITT